MQKVNNVLGYFPYDKPRDSQKKGMEIVKKSIENNGIVTMEGACGTGKTLTAITPYLNDIKNDKNDISRVLIVTNVKQQMVAFQDEVEKINKNIEKNKDKINALTLIGLSDIHPYVHQGLISDNSYQKIDNLRENTRKIVEKLDLSYDYLCEEAEKESVVSGYAYSPDKIPSINGKKYDPYYAKYMAEYDSDKDNSSEVIPFNPSRCGLLEPEDIRDICIKTGYCPHSIMRISLKHFDVIIGNYNHIFHPLTADKFTVSILDESTAAIFDEAHNIVPRVRDFLTEDVSVETINKSKKEIKEIKLLAETYKDKKDIEDIDDELIVIGSNSIINNRKQIKEFNKMAYNILDEEDISIKDLENWIDILDKMMNICAKMVDKNKPIDKNRSIQLRDPTNPKSDNISDLLQLGGDLKELENGLEYGSTIKEIRGLINENCTTHSYTVGKLLYNWNSKDHIKYYRSIEMDDRFKIDSKNDLLYDWQDKYICKLTINNCIPRDYIAQVLSVFHSSVLMSATLEPLDIYHYTTGISKLDDSKDENSDELSKRPVYKCTFGLNFPIKNRKTIGVDIESFKYNNKKSPFIGSQPNTKNQTRKSYKNLIFDIIESTDGNSLICMPSYNEAKWIGKLIKNSRQVPSNKVLIDSNSKELDHSETMDLKNKFFRLNNGILVTSAYGTLIEGIDYKGDKLSNVIVCGVPIENTRSDHKQAIKAAYEELFDNELKNTTGFDLAFTIPAVRKTRQAMGRVIRTNEDVGTRILIDSRYTTQSNWDSVQQYLSEYEIDEMEVLKPNDVKQKLDSFWGDDLSNYL